ncbi:hypothetical protein [Strawberry virus 2]|nr:hypothetical protein [Strawberry virus 2]
MNVFSVIHLVLNLYWYIIELTWNTTIAHSTTWTQVCFVLLTLTPVLIMITYLMMMLKVISTSLRALLRHLLMLSKVLLWTLKMLWNCLMMPPRVRELLYQR